MSLKGSCVRCCIRVKERVSSCLCSSITFLLVAQWRLVLVVILQPMNNGHSSFRYRTTCISEQRWSGSIAAHSLELHPLSCCPEKTGWMITFTKKMSLKGVQGDKEKVRSADTCCFKCMLCCIYSMAFNRHIKLCTLQGEHHVLSLSSFIESSASPSVQRNPSSIWRQHGLIHWLICSFGK